MFESTSFVVKPVKVSQLRGHRDFQNGKNKSKSVVWEGMKQTYYEYAEMTKINGMYYMRKNVTTGFSRILWAAILTTSFIFGSVLIFLLWQKYIHFPTRMTIASPMTTLQVPFPAITICHPQSVIDYKTESFVKKIKFPVGATEKSILEALPILGVFTEHQWTSPLKQDIKLIHNVLILNNISITAAVNELGMTCEDFIVICYWAGKKFPCFQNHVFFSWTPSTSHFGACCSFNYHPNTRTLNTFGVNSYGLQGGLSVIGTGSPQAADGKSGAIYSEGFMV